MDQQCAGRKNRQRLHVDGTGAQRLVRVYEEKGAAGVGQPCQGREGANILYVLHGQTLLETEGPYGDQPCVYQAAQKLPEFDGRYPVVGSWLVNGYACGIGIREDTGPVTQNTSRFVPHVFKAAKT